MALFNRKPKKEETLNEGYDEYGHNYITRIGDYRTYNGSRRELRNMYDIMSNDAIASAALDSWASDMTQVDLSRQHSVWIEGPNVSLNKELEDFLYNVIGVEDKLFTWAYQVVKYGEMYLNTHEYDGHFVNDESESDWSFEVVEHPENLSPLYDQGQLVGYYEVSDDGKGGKVYPPNQFISFLSDFTSQPSTMKLKIKEGEKVVEKEYKTVAGTSFLRGAVVAYQVLKTIEDVILLTRVGKSSYYRLVNIEVGNASDKEAKRKIDEVKKIFTTRETLNLMDGAYKSTNDPVAAQENVYVPMRNGVGAITMTPVGGDYDLKSALDLDYFRNKYFAALMIPKAYLGFDGEASSVLGDNSLVRLDEKYARRCKRGQNVVRNGIMQLCNYYLTHTGRNLDNVEEFKVCMTSISSQEEKVNRDEFEAKINAASSLVSLVLANFPNQVDKEKLFTEVCNNIVGIDPARLGRASSNYPTKNYGARGTGYGDTGERRFIKLSKSDVDDIVSSDESVDIRLDMDGKIVPLSEDLLIGSRLKRLLSEATYKDLKQRVQTTDPERARRAEKLIITYVGLNRNGDVMFKTTSGSTPGKFWYQTIRLLDLPEAVAAFKDDPEITDQDIVKYSIEGNLAVYCNDPSFLYWGWKYMADKGKYGIQPETRPPVVRNPQQKGAVCKHIYAVLRVLPFWTNRIVGDLRKQFFKSRPAGTKAPKKVENPAAKDVPWKNN